jgi:ABC-type multidrug transport system ATPase subunit
MIRVGRHSVTLLRVSALSKSFPTGLFGQRRKVVLGDVDLEVAAGEICALMGDNGSGKTTLMRLIAGVLSAEQGEVRVEGRLVQADGAARAVIGFASGEERSFQLRLSGLENLRFFGALYGLGQRAVLERIGELEHALELRSFVLLPVGQTSAGMRARLGLARALLHRPKLLLLDEPTKSIDQAHLANVHALVREHARRGGGALVVTHLPDEARALTSRIERLVSGRMAPRAALVTTHPDARDSATV